MDEKALLAEIAYVDLNPIRTDLEETPQELDFTSLQGRSSRIPADPNVDDQGSTPAW